ncbi:MAG: nucleoside triphosphate pyrophosphohydrolase [Acidobacteriota bacterium]
MAMTEKQDAAAGFQKLVEIMARLRAPGGCPWDREQTFDTIKPYLLEETYEVLEAIDARDWKNLAEELGDLMLQAVFFSQMASEAGHFDIGDALEAITSKLIRRHPHVFGDGSAKTSAEVLKKWDEIKAGEKVRPKGLLATVPRSLPALVEGEHISRKAAGAGFDWPKVEDVFEKLREELGELDEARKGGSQEEVEGEIGDLLFVMINISRFLKVDPEQALRKTNAKFRRRFSHVEDGLEAQGKVLKDASLDEMETLWQAAKQQGK